MREIKDKNGRVIKAGDIVNHTFMFGNEKVSLNTIVGEYKGRLYNYAPSDADRDLQEHHFFRSGGNEYEVIGTLKDNPDLLTDRSSNLAED